MKTTATRIFRPDHVRKAAVIALALGVVQAAHAADRSDSAATGFFRVADETRPRLLREAAVGNFPQWAKA